ncbi:ankyrin repeat and SOCS box protein 2 [Callorhinchus milii]|uniref:Ankyrin repeat and SOCS box containing 2 n=1 Tax=Callorhinchus milii TaxID=7868 RepID=V9KAT6_CALMI|nr:ankyrin repeat and SOCS box protein 2 [Callorhinchus milii]XP_007902062.1 ankyrin repeat and SOCS box protein 2 [Callorhinchus milii]|eukprot:gi/632971214/ref/XP_007902061.1/ PREDICTED: ankyrin repeat and SOCS box protein 2 [Callorhinchus milii]
MATGATSTRDSGPTLGQEEYSLYSSLSEDELIQMAVEQSLAQCSSSGQLPGTRGHNPPRTQRQIPVNCPAIHPKGRTPQANIPPANTPHSRPYRRYNGSLFVTPKPIEVDPVVIAIKNGDEATLSRMIKSGRKLCEPNKDGWLPLHDAVFYNQVNCLKLLLQAYPRTIDCRTLAEETALFISSSKGHIDCMRILLEAGAECDISSKTRETPLYKACEHENVEAVRLLIQFNADINHRCNRGWTALHESMIRNHVEAIELLLRAGAKVEAKNAYGITALFVAAQSGQLNSLRFLTQHGADINTQANDNASALYEACKNEHEDVVEFLLSQGADANKGNKDGWLPIHVAAQKGNLEITALLLPVTSRVRVKRSGINPLHLAAQYNRNDIIEDLIKAGYDVNAALSPERSRLFEDKRTSVLYFAVMNNNIDAIEMLLKAGARPNSDILTPLLVAIRHGSIKAIKMLLDHGANINAYVPTHPTSFPATIMFCMKYLGLLKWLLDLGCDAESCFKCEYGNLPHPEVEQRRTDDYQQQQKTPKIVHFCEIISTAKISRLAGPIIDVLLDYVGNVQICSKLKEHLDSYDDWAVIKAKSEPPRPLAHLCRVKIRHVLGKDRIQFIEVLPMPCRLQRYLQHNYSNDF